MLVTAVEALGVGALGAFVVGAEVGDAAKGDDDAEVVAGAAVDDEAALVDVAEDVDGAAVDDGAALVDAVEDVELVAGVAADVVDVAEFDGGSAVPEPVAAAGDAAGALAAGTASGLPMAARQPRRREGEWPFRECALIAGLGFSSRFTRRSNGPAPVEAPSPHPCPPRLRRACGAGSTWATSSRCETWDRLGGEPVPACPRHDEAPCAPPCRSTRRIDLDHEPAVVPTSQDSGTNTPFSNRPRSRMSTNGRVGEHGS